MLLFEDSGSGERVLFTGDLLSPLLRKQDLAVLDGVDLVICDANNRYPYPGTNHWSIRQIPDDSAAGFLNDFLDDLTLEKLLLPHAQSSIQYQDRQYLEQFSDDFVMGDQPFVLLEFLNRISPRNAAIVHYSGSEDKKYYDHPVLSSQELSSWLVNEFRKALPDVQGIVPGAGKVMDVKSQ
jgi:hypothetical protein